MIDPKLLELIRCPVDGQTLVQANDEVVTALNQLIERREVRDASDGVVEQLMEGALVTADKTRAHAVRGGIPTLIPGESIVIPEFVRTLL
jgi:uncharacterized protein YbaR (Trm112 family)